MSSSETRLLCGFSRQDITPRIGVELAGYGPYLHRYSTEVRDRLECRAVALRLGQSTLIIVSCDLGAVSLTISSRVREHLRARHGIPIHQIMVLATHTHSGPAVDATWIGWGAPDEAYLEILPHRLIATAEAALADLAPTEIRHAETPCNGLAINREYDRFSAANVEDVARAEWLPEKPELTDRTCHVLSFTRNGQLRGVVSSYGCHPVVGGPVSTSIHGDWPGLASHALEQRFPGSCAIFLQGAQGDINAAITATHGVLAERALTILSERYVQTVMTGIAAGQGLAVDRIGAEQSHLRFSRKPVHRDQYAQDLSLLEAEFAKSCADDGDRDLRLGRVKIEAIRHFLSLMDRGGDLSPPIELQALGIGPLRLLAAPFEIHRQLKLDVVSASGDQVMPPVILGFCNATFGYAIDDTVAARGGYAADLTPYLHAQLPFANIHQELVAALAGLDRRLVALGHQAGKTTPP